MEKQMLAAGCRSGSEYPSRQCRDSLIKHKIISSKEPSAHCPGEVKLYRC